ncbi:hypothetical protein [Aspergillus lentulus narnavirus 1]|nr:hypothetical protein [Aspergillus lentulus narnavirus 1]
MRSRKRKRSSPRLPRKTRQCQKPRLPSRSLQPPSRGERGTSRSPLGPLPPRRAEEEIRSDSQWLLLEATHPVKVDGVRPLRLSSQRDSRESNQDGMTPSFTRNVDPYESRNLLPRSRIFNNPHSFIELNSTERSLARGIDRRIRVSSYQLDVHCRNVQGTYRLDPGSWPRDEINRPLWPSSPTLNEWLEMVRQGDSPCDKGRPSGKTVRVSRSEQASNALLTKRICTRHIIGIRSDVEVPQKFLGYFRYRQGFLILTAPYSLPIGLARWLVGLWCRDPHSLWLEWFGTLKQYLREVPASLIRGLELNKSVEIVEDDPDSD